MNANQVINKIKGMFSIIRPIDDLVMGIGVIIGFALAGSIQGGFPLIGYLFSALGVFFVSAHAMVANDIIDIEIDKINQPDRVLPSGILSIKFASVYAIILAIVGVGFFGMMDYLGYTKFPYSWLFALVHILLADFYNLKLKKSGFIGNIVVAYMAFALFLLVDIFYNGRLTLLPMVVGIMAFCASLSREVFKGIIDIEGDRKHGVKTVAVVLGSKKAKYIGILILFFCAALSLYLLTRINLIGQIGVIITEIHLSYVLVLAKNAEKPSISKSVKTLILLAPLILSPFLILDQIFIL